MATLVCNVNWVYYVVLQAMFFAHSMICHYWSVTCQANHIYAWHTKWWWEKVERDYSAEKNTGQLQCCLRRSQISESDSLSEGILPWEILMVGQRRDPVSDFAQMSHFFTDSSKYTRQTLVYFPSVAVLLSETFHAAQRAACRLGKKDLTKKAHSLQPLRMDSQYKSTKTSCMYIFTCENTFKFSFFFFFHIMFW